MVNDISVVFKAQDQLTREVQKMRESVKKMGKDVADYKSIQDKAFKDKATLQLDLRKAKESLKELAKAEKDGTEESKKAYMDKQSQINEMTEGIKRYTQVINDCNKAERDLTTKTSRNNNNPNNDETPSLGKQLIGAGMFKEVGQSIGNFSNTLLSSQFGDRVGSNIGNAVSSTLSMAGMGASVGGIQGAIVGAVAGLAKGGIDSLNNNKATKDDYFRDNVQNIITDIKEKQNATLENSKQLASNREKDLITFKTLLGGKENANKFLNDTEKFAGVTPFEQQDLLNMSKLSLNFGYKQNEIIPMLQKWGDGFSSLGVTKEGQLDVIKALGRMKSSQKTSLEQINILQDKGFNATEILAKKMGTSQQKVYEMISKGAINGADTVRVLTEEVGKKYKGAMEDFSKTTEGLESTLADAKAMNDRKEGEGYNKERKKGLEKAIAFESGLNSSYREKIGQYKASLKNAEEEILQNTIKQLTETEGFKKASGEQQGRMLIEAETKAKVDWLSGPQMQTVHEAEMAQMKSTQEYIKANSNFVGWGQELGEQASKGFGASFMQGVSSYMNAVTTTGVTGQQLQDLSKKTSAEANKPKASYKVYKGYQNLNGFSRRATGGKIADDYTPTYVDKNERVLTARENAEYEANRGRKGDVYFGDIVINGNSNNNGDEIANLIVNKITNALENIQ